MPQYDSCTNCFMPLNGNTVCSNCGHDKSTERKYPGTLPAFTILNNKYLVGRVLGKGGFGITYNALDFSDNSICAIKEYMPAEYSTRSGGSNSVVPFSDDKSTYVFNHGREKFTEEAKTLIRMQDDPIVVDILDYFNENNTSYLVMEFLDGQDLRKMAKANGGKLDADYMKGVFVTIASSLMEVHKKNILHRDLSPENIIVTKSGNIKLIDFGAARNFVSTQNKGMSILLKPGFAPPEQYNTKGAHGPWSDVYALCATFYNLVSGKPLIDALFRYRGEQQPSLASLGCNVTKKTSDVIEKGMELDYTKRYRDFRELLDDIDLEESTQKKPSKFKKHSKTNENPAQPAGSQSVQSVQPVNSQSVQSQNVYGTQYRQGTTYFTQAQNSVNNTVTTEANYGEPAAFDSEIQTQGPRFYIAAIVGGNLYNKIMISTNDIFKIGRSVQSCQYVIKGDTNISRIHCYIRIEGNGIYLTDSSSNGTYFANGYRLEKNKEYKINPGNQFYIATPNHMLIVGV